MSDSRVSAREKYLRRRIEKLQQRLEAVEGIGYNTHPSWGCSEEFNDGWKACREQIDDCIKEAALQEKGDG